MITHGVIAVGWREVWRSHPQLTSILRNKPLKQRKKSGGGGWFEEKCGTLYNQKNVIWENLLKGRVGWGWMREFGEGMCT